MIHISNNRRADVQRAVWLRSLFSLSFFGLLFGVCCSSRLGPGHPYFSRGGRRVFVVYLYQ
jgi:hypothetical protein